MIRPVPVTSPTIIALIFFLKDLIDPSSKFYVFVETIFELNKFFFTHEFSGMRIPQSGQKNEM